MDDRTKALLDKCECMSLLCSKATGYWSFIKFIFQIPLILTSSVMCILNSFDKEEGSMKIPNVVVNGVSVLLLALQNNLKVAEKVELFKNLSNSYLLLAHSLEAIEPDSITREIVNNMIEKYDSLQQQVLFEDIPKKYKLEVIQVFKGRAVPIQLNGASGLTKLSAEIV